MSRRVPGDRISTRPSSSARSTTCIGAVSKTSPPLPQASRSPDKTSAPPTPLRAPARARFFTSTSLFSDLRSHASLHQVGGEGLGLVYADVGLKRDRRHQVVDDVAPDHPVWAPVVGEPDCVNLTPVEAESQGTQRLIAPLVWCSVSR